MDASRATVLRGPRFRGRLLQGLGVVVLVAVTGGALGAVAMGPAGFVTSLIWLVAASVMLVMHFEDESIQVSRSLVGGERVWPGDEIVVLRWSNSGRTHIVMSWWQHIDTVPRSLAGPAERFAREIAEHAGLPLRILELDPTDRAAVRAERERAAAHLEKRIRYQYPENFGHRPKRPPGVVESVGGLAWTVDDYTLELRPNGVACGTNWVLYEDIVALFPLETGCAVLTLYDFVLLDVPPGEHAVAHAAWLRATLDDAWQRWHAERQGPERIPPALADLRSDGRRAS